MFTTREASGRDMLGADTLLRSAEKRGRLRLHAAGLHIDADTQTLPPRRNARINDSSSNIH